MAESVRGKIIMITPSGDRTQTDQFFDGEYTTETVPLPTGDIYYHIGNHSQVPEGQVMVVFNFTLPTHPSKDGAVAKAVTKTLCGPFSALLEGRAVDSAFIPPLTLMEWGGEPLGYHPNFQEDLLPWRHVSGCLAFFATGVESIITDHPQQLLLAHQVNFSSHAVTLTFKGHDRHTGE